MIFFLVVLSLSCVRDIGCDADPSEPEYIQKDDILIPKDKTRGVLVIGKPWPGGVLPYEYENPSSFTKQQMDVIQSAMDYISSVSCVKFIKRTNQAGYVSIRTGRGCNAVLGYTGRKQYVTLETPSCIHKGVVIHEFIHALGWDHEQNRPDRDNFVNIHWDNIIPEFKFAFNKNQASRVDLQGEQYDYQSIMHYYYNAFAIDYGKPTISPKDPKISKYDLAKGYSESRMTAVDIRKMKKNYKCP